MFRTYIDALKKGDLDEAAECLDLTEIPDPARRIVGRELAFKLKEVLDRNVFVIFQDLPDTSVGLPLEAVVHREGRITAERQVSGKRKGQWLFNRATVQSVDRLYDEFESKPLVPELVAIGRTASGPTFRHTPGLWIRHRLPDWLRTRIGASGPWSLAVVSARRDGPARPPDRAGVPSRGLARPPPAPVPDGLEECHRRRSRAPVLGPPDRLAGRLPGCSSRA